MWLACKLILFLFLFLPSGALSEGRHQNNQITRQRVIVKDDQNQSELKFTAESNIFRNVLYETLHFEYSSDIEIGAIVSNIPIMNSCAQNFEYDSYITLTKWFNMTPKWKFGLGAQTGTTIFTKQRQLHNFNYLQNYYEFNEFLNINAGVYYVNKALATNDQEYGVSLGVNYHFIPNKIWTEISYLSGSSNISGTTVNLMFQLDKTIIPYFGVQIPALNSENEFAGVVGFSFSMD